LWSTTVYAQDDSLSLFRDNKSDKKQAINNYKNAVFINLSTLFRGGVSIGYEKYFTFSGVAVFGQAGYTARDFSGQYEFLNGNSIFYNTQTFKGYLKPGYMYEFGLKYYFEKLNEGNFVSCSFFNVVNTRVRKLSDDFIFANINGNNYPVNYLSREVKVMFGRSNEATNRFYHDFSFGAGFRFLKYDKVEFNTINESDNEPNFKYIQWASKKVEKDVKPWLYFTYKIGLRF
jgi:hypothetical protein